jgi:NAD(P)-dependent dehydrogenase (short-subunit alcohol dehydrogenase family)
VSDLLADQTAVVTGGSSGIGRAISLAFAEEGADVVIADIREEPRQGGEPTHERIAGETDADARFVECDVSDVEQLDEAVETAEEWGGIDVMVNNAGYIRVEDFLDVSEEEYDDLMTVNVKGMFFGAQAAAKRMVNSNEGTIINVSSVEGLRGTERPTYSTSKGATRLLTYSLANTLGDEGIRVNAIHPGLVETAMTTDDAPIIGTELEEEFLAQTPQGRAGQPEDIAGGAVFLASDLASYANGSSLVLDGGLTNTQ